MQDAQAKRRMKIMLICLGVLFGGIFIYKLIMGMLFKHFMAANSNPVVTVSTTQVDYQEWQPLLTASGSLRAVQGVNVTVQLAGMVQKIYFTPGQMVEENALLVQQNADDDIALLHSLEANAALANITYTRDQAQYKVHAVSKQTLDTDRENVKSLTAQVAQQAAIVAKKTIRAPFPGRLGISLINPGQYLNPGDTITMLQTLDPIYADFYVPQQALAQLKAGQIVHVFIDTFPGKIFTGKLTTINPGVETTTRNVQVEATIDNPEHELAPGMFATVEVVLGEPKLYLTLPQSAISFNPYGSIVYYVKSAGTDKKGKPLLKATESFVTTGDTRGDQIVILSGLKKGDTVVTSGQIKLKNGSLVNINNTITPSDSPAPHLSDEHAQ